MKRVLYVGTLNTIEQVVQPAFSLFLTWKIRRGGKHNGEQNF